MHHCAMLAKFVTLAQPSLPRENYFAPSIGWAEGGSFRKQAIRCAWGMATLGFNDHCCSVSNWYDYTLTSGCEETGKVFEIRWRNVDPGSARGLNQLIKVHC